MDVVRFMFTILVILIILCFYSFTKQKYISSDPTELLTLINLKNPLHICYNESYDKVNDKYINYCLEYSSSSSKNKRRVSEDAKTSVAMSKRNKILKQQVRRRFPNGNKIMYNENNDDDEEESENENDELIALKSIDDLPKTLDGKSFIPNTHGDITDQDEGFILSGFDPSSFNKCPNGFEGPTCTIKPICKSPEEDNKLKLLTYNQFNFLNIYRNTDKPGEKRQYATKREEQESTHPRMRIHCMTNGEYDLEICQDNQLLDKATLNCVAYDICEDKLAGFKHNMKIKDSDAPLAKNEYYICSSNASVKTTCSEDTVFSPFNNGCVTESPCFGQENKQFKVDDNTYIQCKNDLGTLVTCDLGIDETIVEHVSHFSCKRPNNCKPTVLTFENKYFSYDSGKILCTAADEPWKYFCDRQQYGDEIQFLSWSDSEKDKFSITTPHYPYKVLNKHEDVLSTTCVDTTASDSSFVEKSDAIDNFKWSEAMPESHDMFHYTLQFLCNDEKDLYRWDYLNSIVRNNKTDEEIKLNSYEFMNSGTPCNEKIDTVINSLWNISANQKMNLPPSFKDSKFGFTTYPINKAPIIYVLPNFLEVGLDVDFWPKYSKNAKFYGTTIRAITSELVEIVKFTKSKYPPIGFTPQLKVKRTQMSEKEDSSIENSNMKSSSVSTLQSNLKQKLFQTKKSKSHKKSHVENDDKEEIDYDNFVEGNLELAGYTGFDIKTINAEFPIYYFIATGKIDALNFQRETSISVTIKKYEFIRKDFEIKLNAPFKSLIDWNSLSTEFKIILKANDFQVELSSNGINIHRTGHFTFLLANWFSLMIITFDPSTKKGSFTFNREKHDFTSTSTSLTINKFQ